MKKQHKINIIFWSVIAVIIILCTISVIVLYSSMIDNKTSGLPAEYAFLVVIPYAIVTAVFVAVWLIIKTVKNKNKIDIESEKHM